MKRLCLLFALATLLLAPSARAQLVTSDPMNQLIFWENVTHTTQLAQSLEQLRQTTVAAKENLSLVRDVYAGVNEFLHFDPKDFLESGKSYYLTKSGVGDLVVDARSGIEGGSGGRFNPYQLVQRVDMYGDQSRRMDAREDAVPLPYDADAALGISQDLNALIDHPGYQKRLLGEPPPPTAAEGLLLFDAARADPQLAQALVYERTHSKEAETRAMKLYLESLGASPGKAQQLAATASTMTAAELASVNDKLAQQTALMQVERIENAAGRAEARRETDAMWQGVGEGIERSFGSGPRPTEMPAFGRVR